MFEIMLGRARGKLLPGKDLIAGDAQAGYFGRVKAEDFITGTSLATTLGMTAGTAINDTYGWLKFSSAGKVIYVAQRPFRQGIKWVDIYNRAAVYGNDDLGYLPPNPGTTPQVQNARVTIGEKVYRVRLLKMNGQSPFTDYAVNGEAKDLLSKVIPSAGGTWDNFLMTDLFNSTNLTDPGNFNHAMEILFFNNKYYSGAYCPSSTTLSANGSLVPGTTSTMFGWRPVLELIV